MPKKNTIKKVKSDKREKKTKPQDKKFNNVKQLSKVNKDDKFFQSPESHEKAQRDKYIALWSGVIFFMGLIFLVWILNFQQIFQQANQAALSNQSNGELKEILNDLSETINEARQGFNELNENINNVQVEGIVIDKLTDEKKAVINERIKLDKFIADLNTNIKNSQFKKD